MAQKAYEAYGKSSPLPALLHFPFPPGYVAPPVSKAQEGVGTGHYRRERDQETTATRKEGSSNNQQTCDDACNVRASCLLTR